MRSITTSLLAVTFTALAVAPAARATDTHIEGCTGGPSVKYEITNVAKSSRPTTVKSAYITGPGTLSYNKTVSANVSANMSASVSAEAGVVLAKASTTVGTSLTSGRTWTDGFTYTLNVPQGQRRAMQLFQESRSFTAAKYVLNAQTCAFVRQYSDATNAPLRARSDEWKLVP